MTHDVTRSLIEDPALARWVDQAAEDVVRFMDGEKIQEPRRKEPEAALSATKREILAALRTGFRPVTVAGRCGVSRAYITEVLAEFDLDGIDYSPFRRDAEAD